LTSGNLVPACLAAGPRPEGSAGSGWSDCGAGLFCAEGCFRSLFVRDPATDAAVSADAYVCAPVDNCDVLDPNACNDRPGTACQVSDRAGVGECTEL
jgi:hypothetical protein